MKNIISLLSANIEIVTEIKWTKSREDAERFFTSSIKETEYKIANDNTKIIHCVVRMFLKKKIMEIEKINKGNISIPAPFGTNEK